MSSHHHDAGRHAGMKRDTEALLFASGRPMKIEALATALADVWPVTEEEKEVEQVLSELQEDFPPGGERGFELVELAGGWAFRTNARCGPVLDAAFVSEREKELSPAAMETLAIIAYLQPVTRPQVADIRGVSSDSTVQTLVERGLVKEVGRQDEPGSALLYGTTERFEVFLGLQSLEDLPPLHDFDVSAEQRKDLGRRLGIAPDAE